MPRNPFADAVIGCNLGVYFDRAITRIPARGLADCLNVRIDEGHLSNVNVGRTRFGTWTLNGRVLLVTSFFKRSGSQSLILGTKKDLYEYVSASSVLFLTPRYSTGTVTTSSASDVITGVGTAWLTSGIKAGDQIHVGSASQRDPAAAWATVLSVTDDTHLKMTANFGSNNGPGAVYTARLLFAGGDKDYWRHETFVNDGGYSGADNWYACNGVDDIVKWDGTATQVTLLSSMSIKAAKAMRRFKNQMLYGDFIDRSSGARRASSVRISDTGDPSDVAGGTSVELQVHDGPDPIKAIEPLGDNVAIYSYNRDEGHITLAQFVGDPLGWAVRDAIRGVGPIAGRVVANHGPFHEFISREGAYRFDGVNLVETGPQIWREVMRAASPNRYDTAMHIWDDEHLELLWIMPQTTDADPDAGAPELGFVEYYREAVPRGTPVPYLIREIPATAAGFYEQQSSLRFSDLAVAFSTYTFRWDDAFFQATFPLLLIGTNDGKVYSLNTAQNNDGTAIECFARFGRRVTYDGRARGIIRRVYAFVHTEAGASDYGLTVKVYGTDFEGGDLTLLGSGTYDLRQSQFAKNFVSIFKSARFFQVQFETTGLNQTWRLEGYDIDMTPSGAAP